MLYQSLWGVSQFERRLFFCFDHTFDHTFKNSYTRHIFQQSVPWLFRLREYRCPSWFLYLCDPFVLALL
nr:MAG TPA: hypothetical protein [Caudoviricetes sp.]